MSLFHDHGPIAGDPGVCSYIMRYDLCHMLHHVVSVLLCDA
jgi:hypothetical protein